MKTVRTRPHHSLLNVRGLIFIYVLLGIVTVLFSRSFFTDTLYAGKVPDRLNVVVFFTIPAVLLLFLGIAAADLLGDMITRRPGTRFKTRLLGYFIITVIFSAAPLVIVTGISINEIIRFWRSIDTNSAKTAAQSFAMDNFIFHLDNFSGILKKTRWDAVMKAAPPALPEGIASVQEFQKTGGDWAETAFITGSQADINSGGRLEAPPSEAEGFVIRELPRDSGLIRYTMIPAQRQLRLINYHLGGDFDRGMAAIERQNERFDVIDILRDNAQTLMLFYYGIFFVPSLLMTVIIAISFTRRVTNPIVELTEATRRVAEGDFSVQILARRGDELGLLIRSFNAMVQELEKTRAALVKAEKISIWQNMAQQLAHEIKNPLTPIKLSAERVLRRWRNNPEKVDEIIEDSMMAIIQETEGLSTLLNEFKTLSRPLEPSQSYTMVGEKTIEAVSPYRSSYPKVSFDIDHIDHNVTVKMDNHRFIQVLTNLLINALDSMDARGLIEIRTDIIQKREMRFCRLSIKDSGKGIAQDLVQQIFTPYFTTKESGTGLGLPIVERIVHDHGGSIWCNSAEGAGTTFFVDLPVCEGS